MWEIFKMEEISKIKVLKSLLEKTRKLNFLSRLTHRQLSVALRSMRLGLKTTEWTDTSEYK